jgi:hypothetical protein
MKLKEPDFHEVFKCREYYDEKEPRDLVAVFPSYKEAERVAIALRKVGFDTWVVDTASGKRVAMFGGLSPGTKIMEC